MKSLFFRINKSIYVLIIGMLMSQYSTIYAANLELTTKETSRNSVESCYRYTLRNNTNSFLYDWKISFNIFRVPNLFNASNGYFTKTSKGYEITGVTGNNPIRPYASTDVSFCIRSTARPTSVKVAYRDGNGTTTNTNTTPSTYKSSFTIKNDHKVTIEVDTMNNTSNRYCRNIRIINT